MEYKTLIERLLEYKDSSLPMHMPGHKRAPELSKEGEYLKMLGAQLDITEIEGFDNLYEADGILMQSMDRAAEFYRTGKSFYLVGGSTQGILAAILSQVKRGEKVLCARNCHKSVYNALALAGADTLFFTPAADRVTGSPGAIEPSLAERIIALNKDVRAMVITSPTYEGVISDVRAISQICKKQGILLIVDSAHGAHLGLFGVFKNSARELGADIVVESLHKTLSSLTQTAVIHLSDSLSDTRKDDLMRALAVFGTSSPSYLLLASIDLCIDTLIKRGDWLFWNWKKRLERFYQSVDSLEKLYVVSPFGSGGVRDETKIILMTDKVAGGSARVLTELRAAMVEPEMVSPRFILLMSGMGDTDSSLEALAKRITEIDSRLEYAEDINPRAVRETALTMPESRVNFNLQRDLCEGSHAVTDPVGKIAAEYIWAYPPGVPIIISGEKISAETEKMLDAYVRASVVLHSDKRGKIGKEDGILVIDEDK